MHPFPFLLALLVTTTALSAATHTVLPGGSIQEKVDAAQPGDIVAILGGTYPDDITVNKAVRLVEADGHEVTLTGNVTFTGVVNAPPFEGFAVGSPGKGLRVTNTTGLVMKSLDASAGSGLILEGASKGALVSSTTSNIDQNGGELSVMDTTVTGLFRALPGSLKTVALRIHCNAQALQWAATRSYLGYSNIVALQFSGSNASFIMVGTKVDYKFNSYVAVDLFGTNNKFSVLNCEIVNVSWGKWPGSVTHYGLALQVALGNTAVVLNNFMWLGVIQGNPAHATEVYPYGNGVMTHSPQTIIRNNIIIGSNYAINAVYGAQVSHNLVYSQWRGTDSGSSVSTDYILADPVFRTGDPPKLQPASPCINAGALDPLLNDLDGSRNDIGPGGGCFFDPEGWTTDRPVVISFDLGPTELLRGTDTQVTLSNGQAVGPK